MLFEYSHSIVSYVLLIMNSTFSKQTNQKPTEKLTFGVYSFRLSIASPVCMCGHTHMCASVYNCMYICVIVCYNKQILFLKRLKMETSRKQNVFTNAPWVTRSVGNRYLLSERVVYNLTEKHNTSRDIFGFWSNFSGSHIDDRHNLSLQCWEQRWSTFWLLNP